jgi:voltage-gated potassium channel
MIIDFMAILPFYLTTGTDLRSLRAFRLMRLMRILKIGRYVPALRLIITVFRRKQAELLITVAFMMILMTVSASLVYTAEQQAQPETFLDIPTTMWWAIETLTTVGYGDMAPVTLPGRIFGAITAILGVALFAIPTGILASGFIEVVESQGTRGKCPHCGKEL